MLEIHRGDKRIWADRGPGGYRFTDYLKVGVPLNLLLWGVASFLIPVLWPLR